MGSIQAARPLGANEVRTLFLTIAPARFDTNDLEQLLAEVGGVPLAGVASPCRVGRIGRRRPRQSLASGAVCAAGAGNSRSPSAERRRVGRGVVEVPDDDRSCSGCWRCSVRCPTVLPSNISRASPPTTGWPGEHPAPAPWPLTNATGCARIHPFGTMSPLPIRRLILIRFVLDHYRRIANTHGQGSATSAGPRPAPSPDGRERQRRSRARTPSTLPMETSTSTPSTQPSNCPTSSGSPGQGHNPARNGRATRCPL